jgi:chaperonin GroES
VNKLFTGKTIYYDKLEKHMAEVADKVRLKVVPLGDRALVERVEADHKSPGGIVIPGTAKEKPQEGIVRAIGKGGRDKNGNTIAMPVKVGDKIIFGKYSGTEIKIEGKEYVVVREDDIIGIIE